MYFDISKNRWQTLRWEIWHIPLEQRYVKFQIFCDKIENLTGRWNYISSSHNKIEKNRKQYNEQIVRTHCRGD